MRNPLETDDTVFFTLRHPRPQFRAGKDGPVYRVQFELTPDEWQWFVDANTTGMVIECAGRVVHRNSGAGSGNPPAPFPHGPSA